jgi:hypothetical protein
VVLIAAAWRFRSWLMGVFENVVVLGRSGADIETELFHHQESPPSSEAIHTEPESTGAGANPSAQAIDADAQPPPEY